LRGLVPRSCARIDNRPARTRGKSCNRHTATAILFP
jgi:hypothetical protein